MVLYEASVEESEFVHRNSRAMSESRAFDPYYLSWASNGSTFVPSVLREVRSRSITPLEFRASTPLRLTGPVPTSVRLPLSMPFVEKQTQIAYRGTTPWSTTGFYYTPRYPQSYRGSASTSVPFARRYFEKPYRYQYYRYPARRFVPAYQPIRYSRRYY